MAQINTSCPSTAGRNYGPIHDVELSGRHGMEAGLEARTFYTLAGLIIGLLMIAVVLLPVAVTVLALLIGGTVVARILWQKRQRQGATDPHYFR